VLSSLPSTRPQRPSARRAAARRIAAGADRGAEAKPAVKTRAKRAKRTPPKSSEPPVPRQGFEAEGEIEPGSSVQPPSGADLAVSAVEILGELAQTALSTGERLLKDALARLSGG
jgi:hypothetical protein